MPIETGTMLLLAGGATAGAMAYQSHQARKASEKASKEAAKQAEQERKLKEKLFQQELQAGEYFEELKAEQMALQAQAANISTLANLIASRKEQQPQPRVFTVPPAKEYSAIDRINQAIGDLFKG